MNPGQIPSDSCRPKLVAAESLGVAQTHYKLVLHTPAILRPVRVLDMSSRVILSERSNRRSI